MGSVKILSNRSKLPLDSPINCHSRYFGWLKQIIEEIKVGLFALSPKNYY